MAFQRLLFDGRLLPGGAFKRRNAPCELRRLIAGRRSSCGELLSRLVISLVFFAILLSCFQVAGRVVRLPREKLLACQIDGSG